MHINTNEQHHPCNFVVFGLALQLFHYTNEQHQLCERKTISDFAPNVWAIRTYWGPNPGHYHTQCATNSDGHMQHVLLHPSKSHSVD
jgi:hypothetical protein